MPPRWEEEALECGMCPWVGEMGSKSPALCCAEREVPTTSSDPLVVAPPPLALLKCDSLPPCRKCWEAVDPMDENDRPTMPNSAPSPLNKLPSQLLERSASSLSVEADNDKEEGSSLSSTLLAARNVGLHDLSCIALGWFWLWLLEGVDFLLGGR